MNLTVDALQRGNDVYILTPTTWNPHMDIHVTNEDSMLDWEWASQVVLKDIDDRIDASSLM